MIRNSKSLFSFLNENSTVNFKKYSYIFNAEFENYYLNNANASLFKFFIFFVYELFFQQKYKLNFSTNNSIKKYKWVFVKTGEYIYNDNLLPIADAFNSINENSLTISLSKTRCFNFLTLFNFNVLKRYVYLYVCQSLTLREFCVGLYVEFVVIAKIERILYWVKNLDNQVFISADPADLFSRCISYNATKQNKKFIMVQSGPIEPDTPEWKSIDPDLLISWPLFDNFFKKEKINSIPFFPPRFYYSISTHKFKKDYDLVIFLPWLRKDRNGLNILKGIKKLVLDCEKLFDHKIYIKFHPAGELKLKLSNKFIKLNSKISASEILIRSKKIINFGSTVSYDCQYLDVCCGIINYSNHLPKSSNYLKLKGTTLIKNQNDLKLFLKSSECKAFNKNLKSNDLVKYLKNNY